MSSYRRLCLILISFMPLILLFQGSGPVASTGLRGSQARDGGNDQGVSPIVSIPSSTYARYTITAYKEHYCGVDYNLPEMEVDLDKETIKLVSNIDRGVSVCR